MTKLSIITINYNDAGGLIKTIESLLKQTFNDFEFLIIDGGSTDGSKEIIEQSLVKLAYWVSEKDNGVYHAMNKGIVKATGEYIYFLNSGDYLENADVLKNIFAAGNNEDIIYGDIILDFKEASYTKTCPDKLSFSFFIKNALPHQSTFIRRQLFSDFGLHNEKLKIVADWEFLMNAICKYQVSYKHVPFVVAVFNTQGICSREENYPIMNAEKKEVLTKHYAAFMEDYNRMQVNAGELKNIHNSRVWKFRNYLTGLSVYKLIQTKITNK